MLILLVCATFTTRCYAVRRISKIKLEEKVMKRILVVVARWHIFNLKEYFSTLVLSFSLAFELGHEPVECMRPGHLADLFRKANGSET